MRAYLTALLVLVGVSALSAGELAVVNPKPLDQPVSNPHMGLYLQYPPADLPEDHWLLELADIAYRRVEWADVNPEPGVYAFDEVFGPLFDEWVAKRGRRVAFRVMCQSMHSSKEYVTPKWVFDAGVPGVKHKALRGQIQTDPVFWHPLYLELQGEFVAALGKYLDGRPGLEFVDIGSIGEWGEMHLARWTPEQLAETGHSRTAYVTAYRRMIDAHARAFPTTTVFLNVGGQSNQTINDYAAIRGIHFRQDGLKPGGASYNCGEWLYKAYAPRGVLCNFEFHSGYRDMVRKNWDLTETIDAALGAPISYLNTNLGTFGKETPPIMQEQLRRAAMKVGYRLRPMEVQHTPQIFVSAERKGRFLVRSTWRNEGVAAPTRSLAVRWTLLGQDGMVVSTALTYPEVPTTAWWPGTDYAVDEMLSIAPGLPVGTYHLAATMVDPEADQTINLAIQGRQDDGSYVLTEVVAKARTTPAQSLLYTESFEEGPGQWAASAPGIEAEVVNDGAHEGQNALRVLGTKGKAWNYASASIPGDAPAFSLCRLTAWLKVDNVDPGKFAPYLKIAVNQADGKWIANFNSNHYDTKALGTWQKCTVLAELPANAGQLALAIETGSLELPITIDLRLDDLCLEVLEQP
jgi:hypothetical protein